MYQEDERASIAQHNEDLTFLQGALEAAAAEGELSAELAGASAEVEGAIVEGDAKGAQIVAKERELRLTDALVKRLDVAQDRAVRSVWSDTLSAAGQDKSKPIYQLIFSGGLSPMIKPRLEEQSKVLDGMALTLETNAVYAGGLREAHVPKLRALVARAEVVLAQRDRQQAELAALYASAQEWKARANALRLKIGAQLTELGVDRGEPSPKDYARSFFGRGQ